MTTFYLKTNILKRGITIEKMKFYSKEQIKKILETKERLIYVDDGKNEVIIKYKDIADFIVDYNDKFGQTNLRFFEYGAETLMPIITTFGSFLNYCNRDVRKDIIDRLVYLQQGGKIKQYKIIDESDFEDVLLNLENNIKI